jgi:hypothetical protein
VHCVIQTTQPRKAVRKMAEWIEVGERLPEESEVENVI